MLVVVAYKPKGNNLRPVWQVIDKQTGKVLVDNISTVELANIEMNKLKGNEE